LAAALYIPRVLIPPHPGVLSALGMVLADVVKDYSQTVMLPAAQASAEELDRLFAPLYGRARNELRHEGFADDEIELQPSLDMRYLGQSYELRVGARSDGGAEQYIQDFHEAHRRRFSYANEGEPVEIVNLRLKAMGQAAKPRFSHQAPKHLDPKAAQVGYKQVYFAERNTPHAARPFAAALYQRERLVPGNMVVGPAVLFQLDTTAVIPPGWSAAMDGWGNLVAEHR
jgi:N-methylhydantoinase A